jgi:peroxiredoxin
VHPELIDLFGAAGNNLPVLNDNGHWVLPIPATFILDEEGRIRFAHVDADYRERAEPAEIITFIESIRN